MRSVIMPLVGLAAVGMLVGCSPSPPASAITVEDARSLPATELAHKVLGPHLGDRIIEVIRHESTTPGVPENVEFYSQPEMPSPRINGICSVDVITVEYNWFDFDEVDASTQLRIKRVAAESRFEAVPRPTGEPGSDAYERAHAESCANLTTATDAFRAPDAGDAQWLAAMEEQYTNESDRGSLWEVACDDYVDSTCTGARRALSGLRLEMATEVEFIECAAMEGQDAVNYCYRLSFPYVGSHNTEWVVTLAGGMRTGSSPVQIRSVTMEHRREPLILH